MISRIHMSSRQNYCNIYQVVLLCLRLAEGCAKPSLPIGDDQCFAWIGPKSVNAEILNLPIGDPICAWHEHEQVIVSVMCVNIYTYIYVICIIWWLIISWSLGSLFSFTFSERKVAVDMTEIRWSPPLLPQEAIRNLSPKPLAWTSVLGSGLDRPPA